MIKAVSACALLLLLPLACCAQEAQFVSMARLLVGGADVKPIPDTFCGTNIELIRNAHVLHQAHNRVHSLHPDLKRTSCEVEAGRLPGTDIIVLRATGPEGAYVRAYLDAVMDEFLAFRKELRTQYGDTIIALADELTRWEKDWSQEEEAIKAAEKSAAPQEQLSKLKARLHQTKLAHERNLVRLRSLDARRQDGEIVSVLERASSAIAVKPTFSLPNLFK